MTRSSRTNHRCRLSSKKRPRATPKHSSKPEWVLNTKISPYLAWIYPFLRKAKLKMPNLVLPDRVRSYKPGPRKIMRVLGNAYFDNKTVIVATHNQVTHMNHYGEIKIRKIVRLSQARMLDTLAHEIAHLTYPQHGYEHEEFSRAIFKTFGLRGKCPHCKGSGRIALEGCY